MWRHGEGTTDLRGTTVNLELRDYQETLIADARAAMRAGYRRPLLCLPTGGGKTVVAARIILGAIERGKRVVFLAHRKELIDQASKKLDSLGVDHGIIMANHWRRKPYAMVHVASIATLVNRDLHSAPDLIFIDEAHRARSASYQAILENYPAAFAIGLTATPIRSDGKGLGNLFDRLILGPSVAHLTERGFLVPTRVYAPAKPDTAGVKVTAGDFNQQGLQRLMDKPMLTGDIVSHWERLGEDRQTVCFGTGIEHSKHIVERFNARGIKAAHLDGKTEKNEREDILGNLENLHSRVVSNYGVLTEGWDCPIVGCAIIARPTKNEGLYLQMAGRILRPATGKVDAIILDHAGCTLEHGLVDEDRHWSLDRDRTRSAGPRLNLRLPRVCPDCFRVCAIAAAACPCGYVFSSRDSGGPVQVDGELQEVTAGRGRRDFSRIPMDRRREMYLRWVSEGIEKGWKPSGAWMRYYAMFKEPPEAEWMLESSAEMRPIIAARDRKPGELIGV